MILTNPPFGTKNNAGVDWRFVETGLRMLCPGGRLFSLHKSASRRVLERKAGALASDGVIEQSGGAVCVAELRWPLERTFAHHRDSSRDIAVDLFRFVKGKN